MKRPVPRLHLIGPLALAVPDYVRIAARAVSGGVDAVHVRQPGASGGEVLELARELAAVISPAALIVNDRLDAAMLIGAGGVQLGERGIGVADARRLLGVEALIGRSVHDIAGARAAEADGADWLLAGHVFDTPSHAGETGRGLEWLAAVCTAVRVPVVAIGGITVEQVEPVLAAGAWGIALGRELLFARDPEATARAVRERIERQGKGTSS